MNSTILFASDAKATCDTIVWCPIHLHNSQIIRKGEIAIKCSECGTKTSDYLLAEIYQD